MVSTPDGGTALRIDGNGNLALTGYFNSWMDFNRDGLQDADGGGYFVADFSISGNTTPVYRWAARSSGTGTTSGNGVAFDNAGHVVTAGSFYLTTDFGGISLNPPYGGPDGFVAVGRARSTPL